MTASPPPPAAWNATPLTKFRAPRVRRDAIARPALLDRLNAAIEACPVTLICAPGGYGKTTLLAQLAAQQVDGRALQWVTLDEDDNERHRFFAALLQAIGNLPLTWETAPATLLATSAQSDSQSRAALAGVVNALCTARVPRILLVLDDLHVIDEPDVFRLLESFIERLPDHVSLILGSRVAPPLPLARWRDHAELAEFNPDDLEFTATEAVELARTRLGRQVEAEAVHTTWQRMHGWAAGLTMALQSQQRMGDAVRNTSSTDRHLFAYLAEEILAELPPALREFALYGSVLSELSPAACEAVTGNPQARQILQELYRRNLFVTATDDAAPILRYHDLFRDFLQSELEQRYPERVRELHERAGHAESSATRAIGHFTRAQCWPEAIAVILANGEAMLAQGDHAMLERWIDQIPEALRANNPRLSFLRGLCAWLRWHWPLARRELQPAIEGLTAPDDHALRVRAMFLQVDALNSSGDRELAWQLLDEIAQLPLDRLAKAQLALQRAWCILPTGEPQAVGDYLAEFIGHAEQAPAQICPQTADRIHLLCIGLPRVADSFQRFFALAEQVTGSQSMPWQLAALAVGAWAHLWRGQREPLAGVLERGEALLRKFGGMRLIAERMLQFRTQYLTASGSYAAAEQLSLVIVNALMAPEAAAHRAVWLRAYQHPLARLYWVSQDYDKFRALAPALLHPRMAHEWPFIDAPTELVRGQLALLHEDWPTAQTALEQAAAIHARYRMPMVYADPRITLSYMHLRRGAPDLAWQVFAPVLQEVVDQEAVGLLLLEPPAVVDALLDIVPRETAKSASYQAVMSRLAAWRPVAGVTPMTVATPFGRLSEREQEVLERVAAGSSNKHIARELDLSLHTVKRHIANILDKLDCASRGQAADLYRRAAER